MFKPFGYVNDLTLNFPKMNIPEGKNSPKMNLIQLSVSLYIFNPFGYVNGLTLNFSKANTPKCQNSTKVNSIQW